MTERVLDKLASSFVRIASGGKLILSKNPDFEELDDELPKRTRYDNTTLLIIDDEEYRVVPRFKINKSS